MNQSEVQNLSGAALDERFAIEVLGFKKSGLVRDVTLPNGKTTTTNFSVNGLPVMLPPISKDNNVAVMLLQDLAMDFDFSYKESSFGIFVGDCTITGKTIGETVMRAVLYIRLGTKGDQ